MKKADWILIISLILLSLGGFFGFRALTNQSNAVDGIAQVLYKDQVILEIELIDGNYTIFDQEQVRDINEEEFLFTVNGENGDVVIEYKDNKVRVIEETSPKHICRIQGWSNSPLRPITCLPNNIVIVIQAEPDENSPDDITS